MSGSGIRWRVITYGISSKSGKSYNHSNRGRVSDGSTVIGSSKVRDRISVGNYAE